MAELVNKLSTKTIGLMQKDLQRMMLVEGAKQTPVAWFWGSASGQEVVQGKVGLEGEVSFSTKFIGSFEAKNLLTGDEYSSGALFLPNVVANLLKGHLQGQGDDFRAVEFAVILGVKPTDKGTIYEWTAEVKNEIRADNPNNRLKTLFGDIKPAVAPAQIKELPAAPAKADLAKEAHKLNKSSARS